jgi:hypothetical protein
MKVNLVGQSIRVFTKKKEKKWLQNIHGLYKHIEELNFGLSIKQRHGYKHSRQATTATSLGS